MADHPRRSVLRWLGKAAAALGAGAGLLLAGRFVLPVRPRDLSRRADLGPLARLPRGANQHLAEWDVHVFHRAEGIYAVSGRCTHLGCSVLQHPDGFACPCHGARFDPLGQPLSGPATRPLRWHRVSIDRRGHVLVHLDQSVAKGAFLATSGVG